MKKVIYFLAIMVLISCQQGEKKKFSLYYPETKRGETVDDYFGTKVPDPYRWLEDDNSAETKAWVKEENKLTNGYLETIPFREKIRERYTDLWNYPKKSAPFKSGGVWFQYRNEGLQNQSILYKLSNYDDQEGIVFLDPNTFSDDGTVSLSGFEVSDDGKYAAYSISTGGSDWREIKVLDVETGNELDDHINWVKFSGTSWLNSGFFYSRYPAPAAGDALKGENKNSQVYFHEVGTQQKEDQLVYEDPTHPDWGFGAYVTEDKKVLILSISESTSGNAFYVKNIQKNKENDFIKVVENFENDYNVLDHDNGKLLVLTNFNAPNYKVIEIDMARPQQENWKDIIPEKEEVLSNVSILNKKIITTYMKDAHDICRVFNTKGKYLYDIELPVIGSVGGFGGKKEDTFTFYSVSSFTTPSTIYKYEVGTNKSELFQESEINFDYDSYETEQVFYPSNDGTMIPLFIVHSKEMELDGNNPVLLYGYGGFNISLTPSFSMRTTVWLENGGIYAVANIRGGGEYGEKWHEAGTKMNKQNVFDDFYSASKYLIGNGYTNPQKLAIMGGSNGGLLIGAVVNQHPNTFKVAIPAVGVMDMLRYHKFTIGRYWATDYGTSEDSKEMFEYLYNYSPLHNIQGDKEYPATMVLTADHDDRVVPAHSFKYIATLQAYYKGENPQLVRIESDAGHGSGKPTSKYIDEYTDIMAFIFYNMGITPEYK